VLASQEAVHARTEASEAGQSDKSRGHARAKQEAVTARTEVPVRVLESLVLDLYNHVPVNQEGHVTARTEASEAGQSDKSRGHARAKMGAAVRWVLDL
ncbi:Hypothetical protein MVR_LOCUS240, partial [uncultured virus]